jgi:galactosamine-6-phosphate isomerase
MKFLSFDSEASLGESAAGFIVNEITRHDSFVLCAATGGSPTTTYRELVKRKNEFEHALLTLVKLDEWGGIEPAHVSTCETYLQEHLIKPLQFNQEHYVAFRSDAPDPEKECRRVQESLHKLGKINLCILGLGMNGHIAFNEPAEYLQPNCHVARLSPSSQQHPMALQRSLPGTYGFTLGMADILQSETIVFIVSGPKKKEIFREFMSRKITSSLPASFLWLHPHVVCFHTSDFLY